MNTFRVAFTRNHSPRFAIVPITVKAYNDLANRPVIRNVFQHQLNGTEVVLMCTDSKGEQWFWGSRNLVNYLLVADTSHLSWNTREFNDALKDFWEELGDEYFEWLRKNWFKTVVTIVAGQYGIPGPPPGQ